MTRIFLDTEFTGLHKRSTLISLALYFDESTYFYAEFNDYSKHQVTPWIQENVISKLQIQQNFLYSKDGEQVNLKGNKSQIKKSLRLWLAQFGSIEIWADVLAYDWVLFCGLFGGALVVPSNIFYAPFDLSTLFRMKGLIVPNGKYDGDINRFEFAGLENQEQHHALADARVGKLCYEKLMER